MKILGIIPARYASTRFPAKALANIAGKTMIERVYAQATQSRLLKKIIIATDNKEIYDHASSFGAEAYKTSEDHVSGTDRCYEAYNNCHEQYDYIINIQGDEPFIEPNQIDLLASCLDGDTQLATLIKKISDVETLENPNTVKVIINSNGEAIYFSRTPLPHLRNAPKNSWTSEYTFYKHIGMYAYRKDILEEVTMLSPSPLEKAESLEQLRWIENGYRIKVVETEIESIGIDTPDDLKRALEKMKR